VVIEGRPNGELRASEEDAIAIPVPTLDLTFHAPGEALGGNATRALMHSSRETTEKHYIDKKMLPVEDRLLFVPWQPDFRDGQATEQFL
jgi:hypothetical protein